MPSWPNLDACPRRRSEPAPPATTTPLRPACIAQRTKSIATRNPKGWCSSCGEKPLRVYIHAGVDLVFGLFCGRRAHKHRKHNNHPPSLPYLRIPSYFVHIFIHATYARSYPANMRPCVFRAWQRPPLCAADHTSADGRPRRMSACACRWRSIKG